MTACITQSPLSDDDLLSALDGEADGTIQDHLQACAYCAAQLAVMREVEQGVRLLMYRSTCPPTDDLTDYVLGMAASGSRQKIEQHLQTCQMCREEVRQLQQILVSDAVPVSATTPAEPFWKPLKDWVQGLEKDLVAVLVPRPLSAYGALKGADGRERILNYESGPVTVMLRLEKVVDGLKVNGTIIDSEQEGQWANGHAELSTAEADAERYVAVVDEDESFTFELVPPGLFQLNVYAAAGRVLRMIDIELTL